MKLGAKWVKVRIRRNQTESKSKMKSEFETWPATPVEASLTQAWRGCPELVGVALGHKGAAGVGQPSEA